MSTTPNGTPDVQANVAKAFEEINAAVANYISAVTKSNAALWQGIEEITRNFGGLSQESFARAVSAYSTLSSAKSPQDLVSTHKDFVKDTIDSAIANSSKVSEISVRTAQDAMSPLTQHANETVSSVMNKIKPQQ